MRDRNFTLGDMNLDLFKSVVDQLPKGTKINLHQSGEPLLHPQFPEMCEYGKSRGMYVMVTTNGILLGKIKESIAGVIDEVTISLMDTSAVESAYDFTEHRKGTTVFAKAFLKEEIKINGCALRSSMIQGGLKLCTHWERLIDIGAKQKLGQIQNLEVPLCEKNDDPCPKIMSAPVVTWDGLMLLCCRDFFRKTVTGDLNKESFATVFEKHIKIYEEQKRGIFKGLCDGCNHHHRDKEVWKLIAMSRVKT